MREKPDKHYINAYANFISKFECAVAQIKKRGLRVDDHIDTRMLTVSNHKYVAKDGKIKVLGPQLRDSIFFIREERIADRMHPFILMVNGKHSRMHNAADDIEYSYGFLPNTIVDAFCQGFYFEPSYRDACWSKENGYHWSVGAGFHIGRHLFNKHVGVEVDKDYMRLECAIPEQLRGVIK